LITVEAAELLECILEIMQLVFKYLENAQEEENVRIQVIKSGSNVQYEKKLF
jgi:hypothetical protein